VSRVYRAALEDILAEFAAIALKLAYRQPLKVVGRVHFVEVCISVLCHLAMRYPTIEPWAATTKILIFVGIDQAT
jgi:hypothetical protein